MKKELLTDVCVSDVRKISPDLVLGKVSTQELIIKKNKGPERWDLIKSIIDGDPISFTVEDVLGGWAGPQLSGIDVLNTDCPTVGQLLEQKSPFNQIFNKQSLKQTFGISFWVKGNSKQKGDGAARFSGFYCTDAPRTGKLVMDRLVVKNLINMVTIPGFVWRKDIDKILGIESLVLSIHMKFSGRHLDTNFIETFERGSVDVNHMSMVNDVPIICIKSREHDRGMCSAELSKVILNPNITVHWKKV